MVAVTDDNKRNSPNLMGPGEAITIYLVMDLHQHCKQFNLSYYQISAGCS